MLETGLGWLAYVMCFVYVLDMVDIFYFSKLSKKIIRKFYVKPLDEPSFGWLVNSVTLKAKLRSLSQGLIISPKNAQWLKIEQKMQLR